MSDASEAFVPTLTAHAIFNVKMAPSDADGYSVAAKYEYPGALEYGNIGKFAGSKALR